MEFSTENFKYKEFECKCGCGGNKTTKTLIKALQQLRDYIGEPIYINSGYRCPKHNKAVGGKVNSQHLRGTAADIRCKNITPAELAKLAENIPAFANGGIGTYNTFVHVDVRGHRARWRG